MWYIYSLIILFGRNIVDLGYKLDQHVPPACSREINLEVQLGGDSFLHM